MKTSKNVLKAMVAAAIIASIFIGLLVCPLSNVNAQGVGINSSGSSPNSSAGLDVDFTNKGTLITRMTTIQRNAITSPAISLLIFNTDCKQYQFWNGVQWVDMMNNLAGSPPANSTAGTHVPSPTQIVWNWNTISGATGYKWGTINVYNSATDMFTATSKTETSLTCNTAYTRFVWAYNDCGNSTATTLTQTTSACPPPCTWNGSNSFTVTHTSGNSVAPVTKTVTYGQTQTNLSGASKCWIAQNLGSSSQASSVFDGTEASAGWYWQFNRKQGYKHDGTTRTPNTTWIASISETSDWLAVNDPCTILLGAGWRIPTYTEWFNADANGGWNNYNDTYNSVLKLNGAGYLDTPDGALSLRGAGYGFYWCSSQGGNNIGWDLDFSGSSSSNSYATKSYGFSLRCLKD